MSGWTAYCGYSMCLLPSLSFLRSCSWPCDNIIVFFIMVDPVTDFSTLRQLVWRKSLKIKKQTHNISPPSAPAAQQPGRLINICLLLLVTITLHKWSTLFTALINEVRHLVLSTICNVFTWQHLWYDEKAYAMHAALHDNALEQQQQQPFNGRLSGTTRVGRYQKKHSPAHTHPVNVLPLSPFSICNGRRHPLYSAYVLDCPLEQPLSRTSLVFPLVLNPQLHTPCISSPNHHHLFAAHAHTNAACSAAISMLCHLHLVSLSQLLTW